MAPALEDIFNQIALQVRSVIVAEVYARVDHISMLAHYTNLDAFRSILGSRELWFSLIRDTNDTSEAVEGAAIVSAALEEHGPKMFAGYGTFDTATQFEARRHLLETDTYVLSLCEHGSDRRTDRLEMWKDYGHNGCGLCLVLRRARMLDQSAKGRFPVHWAPMEYDQPKELAERVRRRLQHVQRAINATPDAHTLPPQAFGMLIANCVVQLVLGVESQQVVLWQTESADWNPIIDAGVWSVPVVAVEPKRQFGSSLS